MHDADEGGPVGAWPGTYARRRRRRRRVVCPSPIMPRPRVVV
jgi:hypothetical protein